MNDKPDPNHPLYAPDNEFAVHNPEWEKKRYGFLWLKSRWERQETWGIGWCVFCLFEDGEYRHEKRMPFVD